ncbi:MAG: hypothetical protein K9N47_19755 [Prosthecobacter sp.]|uniref:hypothetical protein n=1 Tax=Prosthecobacter sp. TaxID=1965333 RepID=UPI0025D41696|nr:hypothetical protein [Prosthecobacter sp.]MCF7788367.1 hypothetical protein [Prosthecobacter sp.]
MKALLSILLVCTLSACGPNQTRDEITGTQSERVTRATAILSKYCKLPGPLLDAHMAEDVISGGLAPGPSNSTLTGVISFPASDLSKWQKVLSPRTSPADAPLFLGHFKAPTWWPAAAAFKDCEYYEPKKLTGRSCGIVALSPSAAAIYFSTFSN